MYRVTGGGDGTSTAPLAWRVLLILRSDALPRSRDGLFRRESADDRRIRLSTAGFEVETRSGSRLCVMWENVVEIVAYKRDLFTFDEICLGFRTRGSEGFWPAGEDNRRFDDLLKKPEHRYPRIRSDWWEAVVKPASEENWTRAR